VQHRNALRSATAATSRSGSGLTKADITVLRDRSNTRLFVTILVYCDSCPELRAP
jgi:hypothetical protein